jgi:meiosis induction protein kinase IME2/SME1
MALDSPPPAPVPKDTYDSLDKKLQVSEVPPAPPAHQVASSGHLKRHHSLPHHQPRSVDNLVTAARGPVSSRTRRSHAVQGVSQYDAPDEEDELLDEVLTSTHRAIKRLEKDDQPLRQAANSMGLANPYPTPSPSASGNVMLFGDGKEAVTPKPLNFNKTTAEYKWPTPPYDENDWAASASASIWAAGNRF